jgi:geranylgeranyl diphosphate synthase, type I
MIKSRYFTSQFSNVIKHQFSSIPNVDFFWRYRDIYNKKHHLEKFFPRELKSPADVEEYFNLPKERVIKLTDPIAIEAMNSTIFRPVWTLLLGPGKRWRPVYSMVLANILKADFENNKENFDLVMDIVSCYEIVHLAQLTLDDISDGSLVRREVPALHIKYNIGVGLNDGLQCCFQPLRRLYELRPEVAPLIIRDYIENLSTLFMGQAMKEYTSEHLSESFYKDAEMITCGSTPKLGLKTIFKVFGGDAETLKKFVLLNDNLFFLHQIKDDIANIVPSQIASSKDLVGEDISVGKYTPMIIHTLKNADSQSVKRLKEILGSKTKDQEVLYEAIEIVKKAGGIQYAEAMLSTHYESVVAEIKDLKKILDPKKYNIEALDELWGYAYMLTIVDK